MSNGMECRTPHCANISMADSAYCVDCWEDRQKVGMLSQKLGVEQAADQVAEIEAAMRKAKRGTVMNETTNKLVAEIAAIVEAHKEAGVEQFSISWPSYNTPGTSVGEHRTVTLRVEFK